MLFRDLVNFLACTWFVRQWEAEKVSELANELFIISNVSKKEEKWLPYNYCISPNYETLWTQKMWALQNTHFLCSVMIVFTTNCYRYRIVVSQNCCQFN